MRETHFAVSLRIYTPLNLSQLVSVIQVNEGGQNLIGFGETAYAELGTVIQLGPGNQDTSVKNWSGQKSGGQLYKYERP